MKHPSVALAIGCLLLLFGCAEAPRDIYDDFELVTHDEAGVRRCQVWGGTSHLTCVYRLEELQQIEVGPTGVRIVGYLIRNEEGLFYAEMPDGSGAAVRVSAIRPSVIEWMPDRLVEQNRFSAALAIYDSGARTIELISIGALNVPGWPQLAP